MRIQLNDADYYIYTAGHMPRADRDTVVFVHGAAMDHSVWSHQSRYFAYHGYNIAAVDLPGHNLSGGELLTDIESMANWLRDLIARIDGRAIHLVGHSMGALIALQAAADFASPASPSTAPASNNTVAAPLQSLALIGFSYPMAVTPRLLEAARDHPPAAYSMMTQWSHASKIGGEPVPGFWSPGMQFRLMNNSAAGAVFADLSACNKYTGGEDAFTRIDRDCPVLFLCGRLDRMAPAKLAQAHADRHANADIVFLPDCGHSLLSEAPHGVLRELKTFIGRESRA